MTAPDTGRLPTVRIDSGDVSVFRFSNGYVGVTAHQCALHLKPDEARRLAEILRCLLLDVDDSK